VFLLYITNTQFIILILKSGKILLMNQILTERIESLLLLSEKYQPRKEIESKYPSRNLPADAIVTRSAPSPTGFMHIGTVYMCLLNQFFARQTGGVYMLRIEDTDKKRELSDGISQIVDALNQFGLVPDEGLKSDGTNYGNYGPYLQSQRKAYYLSYAVDLLRSGRAYPCFATKEQLDENYKKQQTAKVRPGYYGEWALWRNKTDEEVVVALDANTPFVLRFRSEGSHDKRVLIDDVLKGKLELPQNDLDVPLIKADGSQLPTYHLAHVVDDYLMKTNIILRGDEWLPSTPLHIELAEALKIEPFRYAHFAAISVIDKNGGGKRKLSKRKDPEADVKYWTAAGYPIEGIKAYLLGLANSNFEDWYRANPDKPLEQFELSLNKLAASRSPLLDMPKFEDYCKDFIASLDQKEFNKRVIESSKLNEPDFYECIKSDEEYTNNVLSIERSGNKPRKDMSKWSESLQLYGYFYDDIYLKEFAPKISDELADFAPEVINEVVKNFNDSYNPNDDQQTWFNKVKEAAEKSGFATDNKAFKANPELFKGNVADYAKILRVKLTGKNRTPDLYTMMSVMGANRVKSRIK